MSEDIKLATALKRTEVFYQFIVTGAPLLERRHTRDKSSISVVGLEVKFVNGEMYSLIAFGRRVLASGELGRQVFRENLDLWRYRSGGGGIPEWALPAMTLEGCEGTPVSDRAVDPIDSVW